MGGGLSNHFEPKPPSFIVGCWKVCITSHLQTGERVSLWILDRALLAKRFPNPSEQTPYIQGYSQCLQKVRRLRHPHILKVLEIQDHPQYFEFTTEVVTYCLKGLVGELDSTDACYLAWQVLNAVSFLHNRAHSVHFGLSPSSIFLTADLSVRLFNFNWLTPLCDDGVVHPPFKDYAPTSAFPNIRYSAPEVVNGEQCCVRTDIFSWAVVFYELLAGKQLITAGSREEYNTGESPVERLKGMSPAYYTMLVDCLQSTPQVRPDSDRLLADEAFQTVPIKVLRYFDLIVAKDPKDKFEFFKSLPKVLNGFSERTAKLKVIPLLISECNANVKFAPVLIGPIFQFAKVFPVDVFTEDVFLKVAHLTQVLDPPQILIAFLQHFDLILEKTDPSLHATKVNQIVASSLKSRDPLLLKECFKKLPSFIQLMPEKAIEKGVLPQLIKVCEFTEDLEYVCTALNCVVPCLAKVNHDQFMKYLIPKFQEIWWKHREPIVVQALSELLIALRGTEISTMAHAIPFAAELAGDPVCDPYYQRLLVSWMLAFVTKFKNQSQIEEAQSPKVKEADAPPPELAALFSPLAEQLNLTPAQQTIDFGAPLSPTTQLGTLI
jgi:serine/threonine protein kinase